MQCVLRRNAYDGGKVWEFGARGLSSTCSSCLLYWKERFALRYPKSCVQDHGGDLLRILVRESQ